MSTVKEHSPRGRCAADSSVWRNLGAVAETRDRFSIAVPKSAQGASSGGSAPQRWPGLAASPLLLSASPASACCPSDLKSEMNNESPTDEMIRAEQVASYTYELLPNLVTDEPATCTTSSCKTRCDISAESASWRSTFFAS